MKKKTKCFNLYKTYHYLYKYFSSYNRLQNPTRTQTHNHVTFNTFNTRFSIRPHVNSFATGWGIDNKKHVTLLKE